MKIALIVTGVGLAVLAAAFVLRALASGHGPVIRVRDVPRAIAELRRKGGEHSFLVLMFDPPGRPGADAINLQLSIDNARLGLDWVLLSSANRADRPRVEALIRQHGHECREEGANDVHFLRVEDGDLSELASAILTDLYGLKPEDRIDTVAEGFRPEGGL